MRGGWLRRLALLVLAFVVAVAIVRSVGAIDWHAVGASLGHLVPWQFLVLVVVLFVRQVLNALPLAFFIPGLRPSYAVVNDLGASAMALVAPPPSDVVLRVAMFNSWGFGTSVGLGGAAMNTIAFYTVRFAAPLLGVFTLTVHGSGTVEMTLAGVSAVVAVAIVVVTMAVLRAESSARRVGSTVGRLAHRVRRSIDPDAWGEACVEFRVNAKDTFTSGFLRSFLVLIAMVVIDGCLMLLALRFVGLGSAEVPALDIIGTYLLIYPLTLPPLMGLGILDAVMLAALVEVGGLEVEPVCVAGLVVWRVMTLLGPALMGAVALAWWRRARRITRNA